MQIHAVHTRNSCGRAAKFRGKEHKMGTKKKKGGEGSPSLQVHLNLPRWICHHYSKFAEYGDV